MLHWICPECGRECEPVERDCPECYPEAASLSSASARLSSSNHSGSVAVVSIPQVLSARSGVLPPPLPIPSFLLPTEPPAPIPVPEPVAPVEEPADPVPAGLTALSMSMASRNLGMVRPTIAIGPPVFDIGQRPAANIGSPEFVPGFEPVPSSAFSPLQFPSGRAAAFPVCGANALAAMEEIAYALPAGPVPAQRFPEFELATDPALLDVIEHEAEATKSLDAVEQSGCLAALADPGHTSQAIQAPPAFQMAVSAQSAVPEDAPPHLPAAAVDAVRLHASVAEDVNLLARVATFEAHQRTVRALDASAAAQAPLLYKRFRPAPRVVARNVRGLTLRFWPWESVDPKTPAHAVPATLDFDTQVLQAVHAWEIAGQEAAATSAAAVPEPESLLLGPEVPTMYHLAIPVIPPPAPALEPQPEPESEPEAEQESRHSTMRFAVPDPESLRPPVVESAETPETAQDEPVQMSLATVSTAMVWLPREPEPEEETVLTPIVEAPVPKMARQLQLPWYGLSPVMVKPGPRDPNFPCMFVLPEAYIPLRAPKDSKLIPSPLLHSRNAAVSRPPSWLVTAAVAMLIPIAAIGVVNYWILPAQRASAATEAPVEAGAPPQNTNETPTAANWRKQLQLTGIRMEDSKVRFVLINHAKSEAPPMTLLVHLRSVNARATEPAIASFQITLTPLAPRESRDLTSAIDLIPPVRNVDWSDLRADIQTAKLQ